MRTQVGTDGLTVEGAVGGNVAIVRVSGSSVSAIRVERADLPDLVAALSERIQVSQSQYVVPQHPAEDGPIKA